MSPLLLVTAGVTVALLATAVLLVPRLAAARGDRSTTALPELAGVDATPRARLRTRSRSLLAWLRIRVWDRLPWVTARRRRLLEQAVPETLDVLRATIAAGAAPGQALAAAADTAPPALAQVLNGAARAHAVGVPAGRALVDAGDRAGLAELATAGIALDLTGVTGAPPAPVLAGVATAAADRIRVRQVLLTATAEPRLSARMLAALGPLFLLILASASPEQVSFLFREPLGWLVLAVAAALEVLGILWTSRITNAVTAAPPVPPITPDGRGFEEPSRGALDRLAERPKLLLAAVPVLGMLLIVAQPAGVLGFVVLATAVLVPRLRRARHQRAVRAAQSAAAPGLVDLLSACLRGGLNSHLALLRLAERAPAALTPELRRVAADLRLGRAPTTALRDAADRTGLPELRAAASALEVSDRWGMPPAEVLAARATALREQLRATAESNAARAAARLTLPLVLCFLPVCILLTAVPLLVAALRTIVALPGGGLL